MSSILDPAGQIAKARQRLDFNLDATLATFRDRTPGELTTPEQQAERLQFLLSSLGDRQEAVDSLERVLAGNELQPVNYLQRGVLAARAVGRISVRRPDGSRHAWGTGFLISPRVLLTNNHVLPGPEWAAPSEAHLEYETNLADQPVGPVVFRLLPRELFFTSAELDFSVVAIAPRSEEGGREAREFGFLPLLDVPGKAAEGEWLTIVQHPEGERKQLCVRENRLLRRAEDVLWYSTDTLAGSSGSPVFNNDWYVVALHHKGIPEERHGRIQTVDGRDYDPLVMSESQIKWQANEGIRSSRIAQALKRALPDHPLLQPLFSATPENSRIGAVDAPPPDTFNSSVNPQTKPPMNPPVSSLAGHTVTVPLQITLQINAAGGALVTAAAAGGPATAESALISEERARATPAARSRPPAFDAPFESDYSSRNGYQPDYLGDAAHRVNLPALSDALKAQAVKLLKPAEHNDHVLHYHNYSVVMHQERRFAIYSAANISFAQRYEMSRPTDVWREDPRIPLSAQVTNFFYARNKFDRGHLTRREDLEYGPTPVKALQSAADTCHWTNCTPQHEQFNQNKEIWQGIERHVLEEAIFANHFRAQFITGPVFDQGDPEYKKIQYPLRYWKVVAALNASGNLFATAYLASQEEVIAKFGIEAAPEVPFGPYKTFQVPIAEIERLTQLTFTYGTNGRSLSECDPLRPAAPGAAAPRSRGRRVRVNESADIVTGQLPPGYVELRELDDIVTG